MKTAMIFWQLPIKIGISEYIPDVWEEYHFRIREVIEKL